MAAQEICTGWDNPVTAWGLWECGERGTWGHLSEDGVLRRLGRVTLSRENRVEFSRQGFLGLPRAGFRGGATRRKRWEAGSTVNTRKEGKEAS